MRGDMGAKILVVDDEESIRYTFENFLSEEGHEVTTAKNFEEAVARLEGEDYDIIFSDIILGDKTGMDLLKEAKARGIECPFIVITGYPTVETASESVRLGAFDYIAKPIIQNALVHISQVALKHKQVLDEKENYRSNLEAIFRSVKDGILTVDKSMHIIEMNAMVRNICGYSKEDAGGGPMQLIQTGCQKKCISAISATIEKKEPVEFGRVECQQKDRPRQIVNISTWPLLDKQGKFSGAVMIIRDETRIAALEQDREERGHFHTMIGKSESMQRVYTLIEHLADFQTTVLVLGESGTGKELVADALHYHGERSRGPLVKVNCAALPENLLESELFGHAKGAFTGAILDKVGRFQRADGGTIFLDEIGDIPHQVQIRLLRVLQDMEFERVGDSLPVKVNVRVVAATNKNLYEKVKNGEFREDLYYRLKVVEIQLPPLRERREDIPLLVRHFIESFNKKFDKQIKGVSPEVLAIFMHYSWPGNVRELAHSLEYAFVVCRSNNLISTDNLPHELHAGIADPPASSPAAEGDEAGIIQDALKKTGGNKTKAARLLGISRRTIYRKL